MKKGRGDRLTVDGRRLIVRYWDQGFEVREIAAKMGRSLPTVRKWLARFEAEGMAGLEDRQYQAPAQHSRQTPEPVADAIRAWAAAEPGLSLKELAWRATPLRYPDGGRKWRRIDTKTVRKILNDAGWRWRWVQDGESKCTNS